eukprot:CAMPEP_0181319894 /NCGR_PEP_ID=MMETSP1101-20121128/17821_1 /TAXON_ID=46948 /ORGANISM="Rhodomonas abbreviata, Strain Caron Lab Isolate" /LENGTH=478 /DNA_ID=CAMNT_0023427537 /DNA_START=42 /DNA_END=1475 /DNA_ORIENTATION=+
MAAANEFVSGKKAVEELDAALEQAGLAGLATAVRKSPYAAPTLQQGCAAISVDMREGEWPCTFRDSATYIRQAGNDEAENVLTEMQRMVELDKCTTKMDEWVNMLYSYRGKSRTFPGITDKNKESKAEIYTNQLEILQPAMDDLHDMWRDCSASISLVCKEMSSLLIQKKKQEIWNEELIWRLFALLDKIFILDNLKNMKASINNDLASYKRAQQVLAMDTSSRADIAQQQMQDMQFYTYLAKTDHNVCNLREEVFKVKEGNLTYVWVVGELLKYCLANAEAVWNGQTDLGAPLLLPAEKHAVFRLMPVCIVLLGQDAKEVKELMQDKGAGKEVQLGKTIKEVMEWIARRPVCHVFGDMQAAAINTLALAPWHQELLVGSFKDMVQPTDLPDERALKIGGRYALRNNLEAVRKEHQALAIALHQLSLSLNALPQQHPGPSAVVSTLLRAIAAISHWTCLVLRQTSWKCCRPKGRRGEG